MKRPTFTSEETVRLMTAIDYAINRFRDSKSEYGKQRFLELQELKQKVLEYGTREAAQY